MHLLIANLAALSYEMKIACLKSQIFNESILHAQYVGVSAPEEKKFLCMSAT